MISILLATTGRPEMAERCVRSVLETAGDHEIEIIAAVDADLETVDRLSTLDDRVWVNYSKELRGCSRAWNDALAVAGGSELVLAGDDLIFQEGWLEAALAALAEYPGCLIGFNDGHWGEELSTHYLLPREFVVEVLAGVIAWECYGHSFNDREANERARRAGRYHWCAGAHVHHEHWGYGERPCDDTDTRNLGQHAESEATFHRRAAAGFPNDQEAVIR